MLLLLNQQRSFLSYQRLNCTALETTGAKVAYECKADFGNLLLYENDAYRMVAMHNAPEAYASLRTSTPVIRPSPENALGRVAATKELVQITDLLADDAYKKGTPLAVSGATLAGIRTLLAVPMLKDNHLIGAIVIYRQEVRPFNEKQIALMQKLRRSSGHRH